MGAQAYDIPAGPKIPPWKMTYQFLRNRNTLIPRFHEEFGDTFTLRILPGPRTLVVFSDPADVKEIFGADPSQFHAGKGNEILKPVMGEHSVLLTDDAEHQRARKLLMPAFTGPSMRAYRPLVEAIAKAEVDSWGGPSTGSGTGRMIETLDRMNAVTLDVILQVVFGVTDEKRLAVLRPKVNRMVDIDAKMLLAWSYPRLLALPPWRGYFRNQQSVDEIFYAEITERRKHMTSRGAMTYSLDSCGWARRLSLSKPIRRLSLSKPSFRQAQGPSRSAQGPSRKLHSPTPRCAINS